MIIIIMIRQIFTFIEIGDQRTKLPRKKKLNKKTPQKIYLGGEKSTTFKAHHETFFDRCDDDGKNEKQLPSKNSVIHFS